MSTDTERMDELYALARSTADDPDAFGAGLAALARQDVEAVLAVLADVQGQPRDYSELEALGRKLASAAAVAADREP